MFTLNDYQLLDFGAGRRLERFGDLVFDRLCPAAERTEKSLPARWREADVRFVAESGNKNGALGQRGRWEALTDKGRNLFFESDDAAKAWTIRHGEPDFSLELKGSPFGHLGVFPEQSENWQRVFCVCREAEKRLGRPLRVLNLFAYTGGSTMAAAAAHASVVHLDAAKNIVERAKRNAELSRLADRVRFIADDAVKFVRREKKRNHFYDGVILDPPSYGHGSHGEVWRTAQNLTGFLADCFSILADDLPFVLLSCHTTGFEAVRLASLLREAQTARFACPTRFKVESGPMAIRAANARKLACGDFALMTCF